MLGLRCLLPPAQVLVCAPRTVKEGTLRGVWAQVCDRSCWFCPWVCECVESGSSLVTLPFSLVANRHGAGKFAAECPAKCCQLFDQKEEYSDGKRSGWGVKIPGFCSAPATNELVDSRLL